MRSTAASSCGCASARSRDLTESPEWQAWEAEVRAGLIPMLDKSAMTISLAPKGPVDVKYAVELGLSIMLGKPILVIATAGVEVPASLRRVADEVLEIDPKSSPPAFIGRPPRVAAPNAARRTR